MPIRRLLILLLAASVGAVRATQPFSSGSTGSDGALNSAVIQTMVSPMPGTYIFDPTKLPNQCANNVCNFTTIDIPLGVTLNLTASMLREQAVVWLASGAVTIEGTLNLSGGNGYQAGSEANLRVPSQPGPGGYPGGVGASETSPAQPGAGPGGQLSNNGSYATGEVVYGNTMLVPLRGGSGGSGTGGVYGGGGGAGGGAIQMVSSISITITGAIWANGGIGIGVGGTPNGSSSGYTGSGGAIHLEAPSIAGTGQILALGVGITDNPYQSDYGDGRIRIDSTTNSFTGQILPISVTGPLFNVPLPTAVPTVSITSIGGVTVPSIPTGSFTAPDVTINAGGPVTVDIAANNIPVNTVVTLIVSSETGADQSVQSSKLALVQGSSTATTATASIQWPLGVSQVFIRAIW